MEMRNWERVHYVSKCILEDERSGNIATIFPDATDDVNMGGVSSGLQISHAKREKAYFKLDKNKEEIFQSIGAGIDELENAHMEDEETREDLQTLEEQLHLYERLEHKEEYFITLETYLVK